jgi:hypothetical protein
LRSCARRISSSAGIAQCELGGHFQSTRGKIGCNTLQVVPIVFHLLGFAQLELVEVPGDPAIGDMDQMQLRAKLGRELPHVVENRLIGGRMLDGHENAVIHIRPLSARATRR